MLYVSLLNSSLIQFQVISLILSNLSYGNSQEVASGPTSPDFSTPYQALEIFRKYKVESQVKLVHTLVLLIIYVFVDLFVYHQIPETVMAMLQQEAVMKSPTRWAGVPDRGEQGGPQPRYDASNAANILVGSDEIAVDRILSECSKFGKFGEMSCSSTYKPSFIMYVLLCILVRYTGIRCCKTTVQL